MQMLSFCLCCWQPRVPPPGVHAIRRGITALHINARLKRQGAFEEYNDV